MAWDPVRAMELFLLPDCLAERRERTKAVSTWGLVREHIYGYLLVRRTVLNTVMCIFICNPSLLSAQTLINILVIINVSWVIINVGMYIAHYKAVTDGFS